MEARRVVPKAPHRLIVDDFGDPQLAGNFALLARLGIAVVGEHDAEVEGLIEADLAGQDHALDGHVGAAR